MLRTYIIEEIDLNQGFKHTLSHRVSTNSYREARSFSSFFHGPKEKNILRNKKLYHEEDEKNFIHLRVQLTIRLGKVYQNPIVNHKSIWDFYKYINFDYKKGKYNV